MTTHTCLEYGRAHCAECARLETALWAAIHHYAIAVGGDPAQPLDQEASALAVVSVDRILKGLITKSRIDDLVVADLVRGSNAAARAACDFKTGLQEACTGLELEGPEADQSRAELATRLRHQYRLRGRS